MVDLDDTIVAIASPTSPANRGVVRFSGAQTTAILVRLGVQPSPSRKASRFTAMINVGEPLGKVPVDVMLWPTKRSYSGQPSAELHAFGSIPVLRSIVDAAIRAGARAARPGEFTMRAFLAGRLDLTQAEAVLGVIEAEGRGSLDHALRQLAGNLARPLNEMRSTILNLLADVEAGLDFVDEDIEFISDDVLVQRLIEIDQQLTETSNAIRMRGGGAARPTIALRGAPNVGKSSLLNRLAAAEVAIVADVAGTTRDTVTAEVNIGGYTVLVVDTAGIEESTNSIQSQSQRQGERAANEANIRIWCIDWSDKNTAEIAKRLQRFAAMTQRPGVTDLWAATKSDLSTGKTRVGEYVGISNWIFCSARTGDGIDQVRQRIIESIEAHDFEEVGSVIGTAARCRQSIDGAREAIANAIRLTVNQEGHEFVSSELRLCANCLGEVTGAVYTDDILDRVFSRFCIGK